jgi:molybdopterin-dependent oxidoreductase-like protein/CARDB protein
VKPPPFAYTAPDSLDDALAAVDEDSRPLAGGQSLVPMLNFRLARPARLVDLNGVAELGLLRRAGDVLYRRAVSQIETEVADQCPNCGDVPEAQFLPDVDWLDDATVAEALGQVSGTTKPTAGVHGLGLVTGGVTAQPGDVTLTPDTPVTISGQGAPSLSVQVENQGDSEETGVNVTVQVDGDDAGSGTIDKIAAGEIATVDVPLDPAPPQDEEVSLDVMVEPVPGEQVADNNEASYTVTFGG